VAVTVVVVEVVVEIVLVITGIDRKLEQNAIALAAVGAAVGSKHRRRLSRLQAAFLTRLNSDRSLIGDERAGSANRRNWQTWVSEGIV